MNDQATSTTLPPDGATFFGHPRGLATLFFTEMWERSSYYGMRALLILFMTTSAAQGGLGFDVPKAGAIYALYTSMVYLMGLPGGWLADRFLGQRRAVFWGGVAIALGQFILVIDNQTTFFLGLVTIVVGTGLLKPSVSTMVGQLYAPDDERRDAGFSIFYMGINIGAFAAPLVCGFVGEKINWHYGFGIAGIGMTLGLIQYVAGARYLGDAGTHSSRTDDPAEAAAQLRKLWLGLAIVAVAVIAVVGLQVEGIIHITAEALADSLGIGMLVLTVVFFGWLLLGRGWTPVERKRLVVIFVLFLASCFFWGAYEQAGSSLNMFARDYTDRIVAGFESPASWFQSMSALFVVIQAPIFAWLWVSMRKRQPSSPAKFAIGLILVALGFVVMTVASSLSAGGAKVGPQWLIVTYLLHVAGEMCVSPVGLSATTKLAPARVAGMMMGVWFFATAVGNYLGGRVAGLYPAPVPPDAGALQPEGISLWLLFGAVAAVTLFGGLVLAILVKPIRRLMGGVH
ncbi:MAG: peptide MFS transporter [bacterium]|nr:peptide MFS transporter [bacterium]